MADGKRCVCACVALVLSPMLTSYANARVAWRFPLHSDIRFVFCPKSLSKAERKAIKDTKAFEDAKVNKSSSFHDYT